MAYKTQSPDTSEKIERLQFDRLRQMGRAERYERGLSLVDEGLRALWRNLEKQHPNWSREQLMVEWVKVHYGEELSARYASSLHS